MEFLYSIFNSNWIALFIVFFVSYLIYKSIANRRSRQQTSDQFKSKIKTEAMREGLDAKIQSSGLSASTSSGKTVENTTEYHGNHGGVAWTLTSEVNLTTRNTSESTSGSLEVSRRRTIWKSAFVTLPANSFLILMVTPGYDSANHPLKKGGLWNSLVNKAADLALDVYISGYFGSNYTRLVGIDNNGVKIERPALKNCMILTNLPDLGEKFFDTSTVETIEQWRKASMGFTNESKVDQFGLLFTPEGMLFACQSDMADASEANKLAEFASVLAIKMSQVSAATN